MADRLSLANALAEAKIDRPAAERIATEILDAIQENVATKADIRELKGDLRELELRLGARIDRLETRIDRVDQRIELIEHRLLIPAGRWSCCSACCLGRCATCRPCIERCRAVPIAEVLIQV